MLFDNVKDRMKTAKRMQKKIAMIKRRNGREIMILMGYGVLM